MRIFLISAVTLHREAIVEVLALRAGIEVAGASAHPRGLPPGLAAEHTIVVLDMSGFEAAEIVALVAQTTSACILAINVPVRERDVIACAEAGVACCLTDEASLDDVVTAIGSVERGEAMCSPWTCAVLLRRVAVLASERRGPPQPGTAVQPRLTTRELEIVELVDQGLSNKEIARALCIELPTVKNHVHRILDKLGVRRRADAAALVRGSAVGVRMRGSTSPTPV